ncbi:hypothetical protein AYM40_37650 (plasmid) [Paraburkholderia phytofirmans OLGA172]|uniref:Uncharacterized protein n=1 Tax=Paraburkholderia phytofirmans OLGA172 TaxID=1417228 RepID=A0A161I8U5_9BURK|nr:hypothetical protein [Paraburkholderia phytofirmans]ANB78084.1 hypothetical protein AYM40_37650 [Paraburkholderia phytofirmans OLGA172]
MPGLNLLERFRGKCLKGTAIECHAKYYAHEISHRHSAGGVDRLSQSLLDACVDLNPHRIYAVPTLCQYWAEGLRLRSESVKKGPQ